jgi:isopenicillin N synthase-like dioxygenase
MNILSPTILVFSNLMQRKNNQSHRFIEPSTMAALIPTIDISPYISDPSSAEAANVVSEVQRAATTCGFFQITGHGIPYDVQREAFDAAKAFFALPLEEKRKLDRATIPGANMRGYELLKSQEQISSKGKGKGGDSKEVSPRS